MHIRLIAVGDRQPSWVDSAFENYVQRLPQQWQFRLDLVATAPRKKKSTAEVAKAAEGQKVLAKIKASECVVVLDEQGKEFSSKELAARLGDWQSDGRDLTFVIGGPDGVSGDCIERANHLWSLSRLTLPHGLARILFAEQLYRAWCLTTGHPYHRA
jgi:23S rRNA (pseudouridine1915-N3)-methyltransferase